MRPHASKCARMPANAPACQKMRPHASKCATSARKCATSTCACARMPANASCMPANKGWPVHRRSTTRTATRSCRLASSLSAPPAAWAASATPWRPSTTSCKIRVPAGNQRTEHGETGKSGLLAPLLRLRGGTARWNRAKGPQSWTAFPLSHAIIVDEMRQNSWLGSHVSYQTINQTQKHSAQEIIIADRNAGRPSRCSRR